jgi:negative regulator of sigma E activity
MTASEAPAIPAGLSEDGEALWREVVGSYQLRVDELRLLEAACNTADELSRMTVALAAEPLVVVGSQGQPVANPLASRVADHRRVLSTLLSKLALPDVDAETAGESMTGRQLRAKAAADTRWSRVRAQRAAGDQ